MCYRISNDFTEVDVKKDPKFKVTKINTNLTKSYNTTITSYIPVIIPGSRILDKFRWGLIPHWAKDKNIGHKLANARSETLSEKQSFKKSFHEKRCLILVSGFFEWDKKKDPYHIQKKDEKIFALAGLWDEWTDPTDKKTIRSCTIITCKPNNKIKKLHDRMPVILEEKEYKDWLNSTNTNNLQQILRPIEDNKIMISRVSREVNSIKNNYKNLLEPIDEKQNKLNLMI